MAVKTAFVVDDSRVARVILGRLLTSQGLDVTEIESGEEALERLRNGRHPDVIFMDMVMQGLSGVETTTQIKAETTTQHIPVIMCTGNDGSPERQAALSAGASSIVAKPPVEGELEQALAPFQHIERETVVEEVVPESIPAAPMSWNTPSPEQEKTKELSNNTFNENAFMEEVRAEINTRFAVAAAAWMPEVIMNVEALLTQEKADVAGQFSAAAEAWMPQVTTNVKALVAEEKVNIDQQFAEAAAAWMPEVTENVQTLITGFEQNVLPNLVRDMAQQAAAEILSQQQQAGSGQDAAAKISKEVAEQAVANIAMSKVEQAVAEFNVVGQIQAAIAAQTSAWLVMQQTQLEKTMLPVMQKKLAAESAAHIEAGLTDEVMLKVKSNVQEDVYATIEHLTENVVNPLKKQIRMLTIALVALAAWVIIF